jgi:hypothetical protein
MNQITRKTRTCTLETMDKNLKSAIRAHAMNYGLQDIETDVLMCCETVSVQHKSGLFKSIKTSVSAVYVTPKWLVWVEGNGHEDAAGTAQLKHIDVRDYSKTASYPITPDQGLNVTGRYTNKNRTGIQFIMLDTEEEGKKFRSVLEEALSVSRMKR